LRQLSTTTPRSIVRTGRLSVSKFSDMLGNQHPAAVAAGPPSSSLAAEGAAKRAQPPVSAQRSYAVDRL
jgi:hypothetical protein